MLLFGTIIPLVAVALCAFVVLVESPLTDPLGRRAKSRSRSSDLRVVVSCEGLRREGTVGAYDSSFDLKGSSFLRPPLKSISLGLRLSSPLGRRPGVLPPYPLSIPLSSDARPERAVRGAVRGEVGKSGDG